MPGKMGTNLPEAALGIVAGAEIGPQAEAAFDLIVKNLSEGPLLSDLPSDDPTRAMVTETAGVAKILFGAVIEQRRGEILNENIAKAAPKLKRVAVLVKALAHSDHSATLTSLVSLRGSFLEECRLRKGQDIDGLVLLANQADLKIKDQLSSMAALDNAVDGWNDAVDGLVTAGNKEDFNFALAGISKFFGQAIALRKAIEKGEANE